MIARLLLVCFLLLPGLANAISFDVTSIETDLVGGATAGVQQFEFGNSFGVSITLASDEWYSAGRVVVDFRVDSAIPIAILSGGSVLGRDRIVCAERPSYGCDPVESLRVSISHVSSNTEILDFEPVCCDFSGDRFGGVNHLDPGGDYRLIAEVSQYLGRSATPWPPTDTHLRLFVSIVPEPTSALVFAAGLLVCRARLRRLHGRRDPA